MHKRIFLKYYSVCVAIVIMTVTVLGFVSSSVLGIRTFNTQIESMERAANKVASSVARLPKNYHIIAGNFFDDTLLAIKETINSDVFVIGNNGTIEITTINSTKVTPDILPDDDTIKDVLTGNVYRNSRSFGDSRTTNGYTVGVPILTGDGEISGAVFITTTELNMQNIVIGTLAIFMLCGFIVLLIAFIVLFFLTKQLTAPIYQMSDIAGSYAKGDFSKRLNVESCNEYAPLAIAFNAMADGIDNLEQMRRGFVADVSHELRTPMTSITGFVDGMLDGTIPPELYPKYLKIVSDEVHRTSRMVTSFLDVAKIQAGQMTYYMKPFDIIQTTGKAMFAFDDRIKQNGIDFDVDFESESIIVNGDEDAIYRVIYNLIDNAVKFTQTNGKITVKIRTNATKAQISVRNTGVGISKEEAAHIFERFYKADKSRSMNRKGTGIGLYLVKNIIKEHGEDITLTSKEGEFAQFMFTLPLYNE